MQNITRRWEMNARTSQLAGTRRIATCGSGDRGGCAPVNADSHAAEGPADCAGTSVKRTNYPPFAPRFDPGRRSGNVSLRLLENTLRKTECSTLVSDLRGTAKQNAVTAGRDRHYTGERTMAYMIDGKGPFPNKVGEFDGNHPKGNLAYTGDGQTHEQAQAEWELYLAKMRFGRPRPCKAGTTEELEARGYVGLYLKEDRQLMALGVEVPTPPELMEPPAIPEAEELIR